MWTALKYKRGGYLGICGGEEQTSDHRTINPKVSKEKRGSLSWWKAPFLWNCLQTKAFPGSVGPLELWVCAQEGRSRCHSPAVTSLQVGPTILVQNDSTNQRCPALSRLGWQQEKMGVGNTETRWRKELNKALASPISRFLPVAVRV